MGDYGAIGEVAIRVKFTQQFILDEFLRSVGMTEDEYNNIMNQKEPDYDSRYNDEEWDEIWDKWYKVRDQQQDLKDAKLDFEQRVNLYERIKDDYLSKEERVELVRLIGNYLIYGTIADEDYDLDFRQCYFQPNEDHIDEYGIALLINVDSDITVQYGYEGDPEVKTRDTSDWEANVQLSENDLVVALNEFFSKICCNTAGIKVISAQMSTQNTRWADYWDEDE